MPFKDAQTSTDPDFASSFIPAISQPLRFQNIHLFHFRKLLECDAKKMNDSSGVIVELNEKVSSLCDRINCHLCAQPLSPLKSTNEPRLVPTFAELKAAFAVNLCEKVFNNSYQNKHLGKESNRLANILPYGRPMSTFEMRDLEDFQLFPPGDECIPDYHKHEKRMCTSLMETTLDIPMSYQRCDKVILKEKGVLGCLSKLHFDKRVIAQSCSPHSNNLIADRFSIFNPCYESTTPPDEKETDPSLVRFSKAVKFLHLSSHERPFFSVSNEHFHKVAVKLKSRSSSFSGEKSASFNSPGKMPPPLPSRNKYNVKSFDLVSPFSGSKDSNVISCPLNPMQSSIKVGHLHKKDPKNRISWSGSPGIVAMKPDVIPSLPVRPNSISDANEEFYSVRQWCHKFPERSTSGKSAAEKMFTSSRLSADFSGQVIYERDEGNEEGKNSDEVCHPDRANVEENVYWELENQCEENSENTEGTVKSDLSCCSMNNSKSFSDFVLGKSQTLTENAAGDYGQSNCYEDIQFSEKNVSLSNRDLHNVPFKKLSKTTTVKSYVSLTSKEKRPNPLLKNLNAATSCETKLTSLSNNSVPSSVRKISSKKLQAKPVVPEKPKKLRDSSGQRRQRCPTPPRLSPNGLSIEDIVQI